MSSSPLSFPNPSPSIDPPPDPPHLYFAFGSNLSPTQMSMRLPYATSSAVPLATATLDGWRWIICERGYANVVRVGGDGKGGERKEVNGPGVESEAKKRGEAVVWGLLYELDVRDERVLDGYEGVDHTVPVGFQGYGDYAKVFLPLKVQRWLDSAAKSRYSSHTDIQQGQPLLAQHHTTSPSVADPYPQPKDIVPALVYVDFHRVTPGESRREYIPRMNRGIRECVALGVSEQWIEKAMRLFIPRQDSENKGEGATDPSGVGIGVSGGWMPEEA